MLENTSLLSSALSSPWPVFYYFDEKHSTYKMRKKIKSIGLVAIWVCSHFKLDDKD